MSTVITDKSKKRKVEKVDKAEQKKEEYILVITSIADNDENNNDTKIFKIPISEVNEKDLKILKKCNGKSLSNQDDDYDEEDDDDENDEEDDNDVKNKKDSNTRVSSQDREYVESLTCFSGVTKKDAAGNEIEDKKGNYIYEDCKWKKYIIPPEEYANGGTYKHIFTYTYMMVV
jgi:hypothetical protein